MKQRSIFAIVLALVMSLTALTGCGQNTASNDAGTDNTALASGGVLCLKVNPEIAVSYDDDGAVTKVEGRNDDGAAILADYSGYEGKAAREVIVELLNAIGEAGYFVEEVEGERRQITLEIEPGSVLPSEAFLDVVIADIRACVNGNNWKSPLEVTGESDYGMTDYVDTDYGADNDGVTDYNDTDYGAGSDGVTDYGTNGGSTNYDDTDYGAGSDGVTDYGTNGGSTNYGDTDYGNTNYGSTDYSDGQSDYDDGATDYDD